MAIYLGEECSLDRISRHCIEQAAEQAGLGEKLALRWFDDLADQFEQALNQSADVLGGMGFIQASNLRDMILDRSGYAVVSRLV